MRKILFVILVLFMLNIGFSSIGESTYHLLMNCTAAANKHLGDYRVWVDCLNSTSFVLNGSYGKYGSILFLKGYDVYSFKVYNSSKSFSDTTSQVVYILSNGSYTIKVEKSGYVTQKKEVNLSNGEFLYLYFELEKNQTNQSSSGGGGGLPSGKFIKFSTSDLKKEIEKLKDEIGLSKGEVENQEKIYDYINFEVKYYFVKQQNFQTLYYYFYNNWNQTVQFTIYLEVPKNVSENLNGVSLKSGYKIVKSDPIVSWEISLDPGKSTYVDYTVTNKNITAAIPPVLVFKGINIPNKNVTENGTISNETNKKTEENQSYNNQTNQTVNLPKNEQKKMFNIWLILIPIIVILGGLVIFFLFRKIRKPHQVIDRSLSNIERIMR